MAFDKKTWDGLFDKMLDYIATQKEEIRPTALIENAKFVQLIDIHHDAEYTSLSLFETALEKLKTDIQSGDIGALEYAAGYASLRNTDIAKGLGLNKPVYERGEYELPLADAALAAVTQMELLLQISENDLPVSIEKLDEALVDSVRPAVKAPDDLPSEARSLWNAISKKAAKEGDEPDTPGINDDPVFVQMDMMVKALATSQEKIIGKLRAHLETIKPGPGMAPVAQRKFTDRKLF